MYWRRQGIEDWNVETIRNWEQSRFEIKNIPFAQHEVKIRTGNSVGLSNVESPVITAYPSSDVPYKYPENISVAESPLPGVLFVFWTPIPELEHNDHGLFYNLHWKQEEEQNWKTIKITNWTQNKYNINTSLPYVKHDLKMRAGNQKGLSQVESDVHSDFTGRDVPYKFPENICVAEGASVGDLFVVWEPMPRWQHNGLEFFYNLHWKQEEEEDWKIERIIDWEQDHFNITTSLPYIKHEIKMRAANQMGPSKVESPVHSDYTGRDLPYIYPADLKVYGTLPNMLIISWTPMHKREHNGPELYYNLSWRQDGEDWKIDIFKNATQEQYIIYDLPYAKYEAQIVAGNQVGKN